jgi:hypothetical protein
MKKKQNEKPENQRGLHELYAEDPIKPPTSGSSAVAATA